ncbi:MAG: tetratricopeptide repeat protein [Proteobacteria bacterium]|nr:tetratricopeptide repeat protein [Pseudomonadota bacterium]
MKDILPKARAEAHQALAEDPDNVEALLALANADASEGKLAEARAGFERALALDPSNAFAHVDLSNLLPLEPSLAQVQEAVELDPDNATAQNDLAATELDLGAYTQALAPAQALVKLAPHSPDNVLMLAEIHTLLGQPGEAVQAFDLAQPDTDLSRAMVAAERLTYRAAQDSALHRQALDAVDALRKRPDLDPGSMIDVIQLYLALREDGTALELLPATCAAQPVNCSDLSVNPLFVSLRGKPGFAALVQRYDTVSKPVPPTSAVSSSAATVSLH